MLKIPFNPPKPSSSPLPLPKETNPKKKGKPFDKAYYNSHETIAMISQESYFIK